MGLIAPLNPSNCCVLLYFYYFPRNPGPDPSYVVILSQLFVGRFLKYARKISSALESRMCYFHPFTFHFFPFINAPFLPE